MDKVMIKKVAKIISFSFIGIPLIAIGTFGAIGIYLLIADFLYNGGM